MWVSSLVKRISATLQVVVRHNKKCQLQNLVYERFSEMIPLIIIQKYHVYITVVYKINVTIQRAILNTRTKSCLLIIIRRLLMISLLLNTMDKLFQASVYLTSCYLLLLQPLSPWKILFSSFPWYKRGQNSDKMHLKIGSDPVLSSGSSMGQTNVIIFYRRSDGVG